MSSDSGPDPQVTELAAASGRFRVVNVSVAPITGDVTHDDRERITFSDLAPGGATDYKTFSPATFSDTWRYYFKSNLGVFSGKKDCNFSSSSDNTIEIILSGGYITVVPSRSSPCYSSLDHPSGADAAAEPSSS